MIRVMVIEDDPMVTDITYRYVESVNGFTVVGKATSGSDALEKMQELRLDLLILDIYMPVMNGVELLAILRGQDSAVDAIFLTAANDTAMIKTALTLGAVDYLIKPFSYERFQSSLSHYAYRHNLLHSSGPATQDQVDSLLGRVAGNTDSGIQKGMHPKTLENVRAYIGENRNKVISQDEVASSLGLSKVTVRRYMEYLVSIGDVALEMGYGAVGRPTYAYRKIK